VIVGDFVVVEPVRKAFTLSELVANPSPSPGATSAAPTVLAISVPSLNPIPLPTIEHEGQGNSLEVSVPDPISGAIPDLIPVAAPTPPIPSVKPVSNSNPLSIP